jgi:hypothetical protein
MNKAITDGVVLMPPAFSQGMSQWAQGDGTPGSTTYDTSPTASVVSGDADFGTCFEVLKTQSTQKLRFTGETPLLPGCYLRIRARVKTMSGTLPNVRIAAWAGGAGGLNLSAVTQTGPTATMDTIGAVTEVSAIVGPGLRTGVDMVWGPSALYGHFGLDLTGGNGGTVRVESIVIEDITSAFQRDMISLVDVRDYGAIGDGTFDNTAAFLAADAASAGRRLFVPRGTYHIGSSLTLNAKTEFEGKLACAPETIILLTRDFDLSHYIDAFGGDEEMGFGKAFQALLNTADHETLDMRGRRITINQPLDLASLEGARDSFSQRRTIRNGQLYVASNPAWDSGSATSAANYSGTAEDRLTSVDNIANIEVGSRVTGQGVGREVYVREVNIPAGEIRLSAPLYAASGRQNYTFTRYRYVLDFSGFDLISQFVLQDIEILCRGIASGILLPGNGESNTIKTCCIGAPKDRGVTSIGGGCAGLVLDGVHFMSNESAERAQDRSTIALNTNAAGVKLRGNHADAFQHFAVIAGTSAQIAGNHFEQGDAQVDGVRTAGLVFTSASARHTVTGNHIQNACVEWTNEHSAQPNLVGTESFSGLSITGNLFSCSDVVPWFSFLVVKPFGTGHTLCNVAITDNLFHADGGSIERVDRVDDSFAGLNYPGVQGLLMQGNSFVNVDTHAQNPFSVDHVQTDPLRVWQVPFTGLLPFGGQVKQVSSVAAQSEILTAGADPVTAMPWVAAASGTDADEAAVTWPEPSSGTLKVTVRMDS